jgi:hypothetical protein
LINNYQDVHSSALDSCRELLNCSTPTTKSPQYPFKYGATSDATKLIRKVRPAHETLLVKQSVVKVLVGSTSESDSPYPLTKATAAFERSAIAFAKTADASKSLTGTATGKIPLLLPSHAISDDEPDKL